MLVSAGQVFKRWDTSYRPTPFETRLTHLGIHQPERQRLITDKRLIMTLSIRNTLLRMSPVGQHVRNVSDIPLIVCFLLQQLDPHIGDRHGQSVVEADAAFVDWSTESGHAGYVFRDGDDVGVDFVQHVVGLEREGVRLNAVPCEKVRVRDLRA
jgi:hypothetical protein